MRKFMRNRKGAVTVFVTLLLIPAMLVSGTAVDLARMHTARSIVQDANQLAANTVLTQYEAMLQDIYGLFGIMQSDPVLGDMLNEYIQVAIFGEDWQNRNTGTFQLFYGSGLQSASVTPVTGQNLRNTEVLRRQIEEYAKFRVPVIIMEEMWSRLGKFEKLKDDSEAIQQKMAIDDKINEIDKIYTEIYALINKINQYPSAEQSAFASINAYLTQINTQIKQLKNTRDDWTSDFDSDNTDGADDLERKYHAIQKNIRSLTVGGDVGNNWIAGHYNDDGDWVNGKWGGSTRSNGIKQAIGDRKHILSGYIDIMNQLIDKCAEADAKKAELSQMVDALESKLNSGTCSDEIVAGMTSPQEVQNEDGHVVASNPSVIEEYRSLLSYSLKPMAEAMKSHNEPYITSIIEILDNIGYGSVVNNILSTPRLSLDTLQSGLPGQNFEVSSIVTARTVASYDTEILNQLAALTNYTYSAPGEFKRFEDASFDATHNKEFFDVLSLYYNSATNEHEAVKNEAKDGAGKLMKKAQELYKTITLEPDGAKYYKVGEDEDSGGFGEQGDWGNENEASEQTQDALNSHGFSQFGGLLEEAGNKILLLTYDAEMFSNFTTVSGTKAMSGVPRSTDVNYFFQSELEYLFHGNENSARSNIATVSGLILLVRFVFNYASTFVINEIKYELWTISAPAGPFAPLVRELVRLGYALAESVIDMTNLMSRPSKAVPLFKTKINQWTFSLSGSLSNIASSLIDITGKQADDEDGLFYIDYLRFFLLFKDADTLASRSADLITWNITNKKNAIQADEEQMSHAALFNMSQAFTDFTISTTLELRMLFLSMPFAQRGVNGVVPPKTMPITVTDYRGY